MKLYTDASVQRDGVPFGLGSDSKLACYKPKQSSQFCEKDYWPLSTLLTHGAINGLTVDIKQYLLVLVLVLINYRIEGIMLSAKT